MGKNNKKLTLEYIREQFKQKRNWDLLEEVYINSSQRLRFWCNEGQHEHSCYWRDLRIDRGCSICAGRYKITIEFIRSEFEKIGWKLLSTKYINNSTKLNFECDRGHRHSISWDKFNGGKRCGVCAGNIRKTIDFVRAEFEKRGWKLLSNEYKNANTLLNFECDRGHRHSMTWGCFQTGRGCAICSGRYINIEDVRKAFEERGWKLLSTEYINSKSLLIFECDQKHVHQISWSNFRKGKGCGKCNHPERSNLKSDLESRRVADNLRLSLYRSLGKYSFMVSKKAYCAVLAQEILAKLGPRPMDKDGKPYQADHVIPRSWFRHNLIEQVRLCWHVDNFQWLPKQVNGQKRNKLTEEMFRQLTPYQLIIANLALSRPKGQERLMKKMGLWMSHTEAAQKLRDLQETGKIVIQLEIAFEHPIAS